MVATITKLQHVLPYLVFTVLAIAGVATTTANPGQGIFIAMLVLALLGGALTLAQNFLLQKMKSSNSYEVNSFGGVQQN